MGEVVITRVSWVRAGVSNPARWPTGRNEPAGSRRGENGLMVSCEKLRLEPA